MFKKNFSIKELEIKTGYQCNNNCIFCLNKEKKNLKEFSFKKIRGLIKIFTKNGGEKLIISGGEPLISDYFFDLLLFAKQKGIKNLEIHTNGRVLYYEDIIKELKNFEPVSFLVSFHFPNDKLYRKYSRTSGFYQALTGIKNLIKYNCNFTVNTVVMKPNLIYFKKMVKILKKQGVKKMQFRFIDGRNVINDYKKFVPRYKKGVPVIKKIIKENQDITIALKEMPVCILGERFKKYLSPGPNLQRVNLGSDYKVLSSKEIESEHFIFPNCKYCIYITTCSGARKEYVQVYGTTEFKPIIKSKKK